MKKILLNKTIILFTILTLIAIGFSPLTTSHNIIEQTQSNDNIVNKTDTEIDQITSYLQNTLQLEQTSDITIDEIINLVQNIALDNPSLLRSTIVISQGWGRDTNIFKNSKLQIKHDLFYFWHFAQASKTGIESKTFIVRGSDIITTKTIELYRGTQIGFMFRPLGLYLFQKRTIPQLSHTLFIGLASYVYINAAEVIQIPIPLP